jgi:threonine dehydrogenase-like Zn-dependent dehydrogenase
VCLVSPCKIFYCSFIGKRLRLQYSCEECSFCKEGHSTKCDRTNNSRLREKLYGKPFAGLFGYSHFAGGFGGGQAEYVRCPIAGVNLLEIPNSDPGGKASYPSGIIPTSYHSTVCADVKKKGRASQSGALILLVCSHANGVSLPKQDV